MIESGAPGRPSMSLREFAAAVGVTPRWVQNAARSVEWRGGYTVQNALCLHVARSVALAVRWPLRECWCAEEVLAGPGRWVTLATPCRAVGLRVDRDLLLSTFAGRLSAPLPARRRPPGRPRRPKGSSLGDAARHGLSYAFLRTRRDRTPLEWLREADRRHIESTGWSGLSLLAALLDARVPFVLVGNWAAACWGYARLGRAPVHRDVGALGVLTPVAEPRLKRFLRARGAVLRVPAHHAAALARCGITLPLDFRAHHFGSCLVGANVRAGGGGAFVPLDLHGELPGVGRYDDADRVAMRLDGTQGTLKVLPPAILLGATLSGTAAHPQPLPLRIIIELAERAARVRD